MAFNAGGNGPSALKGGREEGAPLTVNLMNPHPKMEAPSLETAMLLGAHTATVQTQGAEGYDFRNFKRDLHFPRNRGTIE
jgi:hypothetical protein